LAARHSASRFVSLRLMNEETIADVLPVWQHKSIARFICVDSQTTSGYFRD